MSDIDTFESICESRGQPIELFDITPHPARDIRGGRFIANPDPIRVGIWKLPDEVEGGLMVCGTYHDKAPHQWHYNCGERAAVAHLLAERDRLRAELERLRSAPVAMEVPEPSDLDWQMIKDQAESAGLEYPDGFYDGIAYARRNARTCSNRGAAESGKDRYFWCDPEALDFHFTDSLEGARFQAKNAVQSANEDCEDYEFEEDEKKICYGIVLGRAQEFPDSVDPEFAVLKLVDVPMILPLPEPTVQQWIHEVLTPAEADPEPHATMRHAIRWFREHARAIPPSRILKDGEVAVRVEILFAMEGCIAALRADAELIPSKALDYLDALRSKGCATGPVPTSTIQKGIDHV